MQPRRPSRLEKSSADTREAHFRGIEIENGVVSGEDKSDDANTASDSERKRKTNSIAANRARRERNAEA